MEYENLPRVSEARHTGNMILSMPKLAGTFEYLEGNTKTAMVSSEKRNASYTKIWRIGVKYFSTF